MITEDAILNFISTRVSATGFSASQFTRSQFKFRFRFRFRFQLRFRIPDSCFSICLTCDQAFFFFQGRTRRERHEGIIGRGHDLRLPYARFSSSFNFCCFGYSFLKSVHWLRMTGAEDSLLLSLYILNLFWNFLKGISKFMLKCHGFVHVINSYFVFSLLPPFSGTRRGSLRLQTSRLESPCLFLARVSVLMPP